MQSRLQSLTESFVNVFVGYSVAVLSQLVVLGIAGYFTVISICRSYCLRRWFNSRSKDKKF